MRINFDFEDFDCVRIGDDPVNVEFWACVLDVSAFDIRYAMQHVGDGVSAVTRYLLGAALEASVSLH